MFRNEGNVRDSIRKVGVKNCFISEITIAELFFGYVKAENKQRKLDDIHLVQTLFKVVPAYSSFQDYGEIRYSLERAGMRIDQFDLLIGATARHHNLVLVTSNTKHFERIKDLKIEDWK